MPFRIKNKTAETTARSRGVAGPAHVEAPADLAAAIGREATLARLGAAFSRLPPRSRQRCARPLTGNSLTDAFVHVEADDIPQQQIEGVIVDGERDRTVSGCWTASSRCSRPTRS